MVIYPIFDLTQWKPNLLWYLEKLESIMINTCKAFLTEKEIYSNGKGEVFVDGERKIGFVGFHNQRWITSHGFSLNINNDLGIYSKFIPCGQPNLKITSMEFESSSCPFRKEEIEDRIIKEIEKAFNCHVL